MGFEAVVYRHRGLAGLGVRYQYSLTTDNCCPDCIDMAWFCV